MNTQTKTKDGSDGIVEKPKGAIDGNHICPHCGKTWNCEMNCGLRVSWDCKDCQRLEKSK